MRWITPAHLNAITVCLSIEQNIHKCGGEKMGKSKICCKHLKTHEEIFGSYPSSIYSWSIGHILEHDFFCLGHLGCAGSKGKKVDLRNSERLLRVVFSTF